MRFISISIVALILAAGSAFANPPALIRAPSRIVRPVVYPSPIFQPIVRPIVRPICAPAYTLPVNDCYTAQQFVQPYAQQFVQPYALHQRFVQPYAQSYGFQQQFSAYSAYSSPLGLGVGGYGGLGLRASVGFGSRSSLFGGRVALLGGRGALFGQRQRVIVRQPVRAPVVRQRSVIRGGIGASGIIGY